MCCRRSIINGGKYSLTVTSSMHTVLCGSMPLVRQCNPTSWCLELCDFWNIDGNIICGSNDRRYSRWWLKHSRRWLDRALRGWYYGYSGWPSQYLLLLLATPSLQCSCYSLYVASVAAFFIQLVVPPSLPSTACYYLSRLTPKPSSSLYWQPWRS